MPDSADDPVERITALIVDGKAVDWEQWRASERLDPGELRALQMLQTMYGAQARPENVETADAARGIRRCHGFELHEELGRGSYAEVHRATDPRLQREVALKIVRKGVAGSDGQRETFLREARALASVEQPNIVRIFSIEEDAEAILLVLELIAGETLERRMSGHGPFGPVEAAHVGIDLCRALSAIHAKGIVHRDLRPANVMRACGGRIVLLDFGIAVVADQPVGTPGFAGTPLLMAPEQFANPSAADRRTDLFSLGCLLYWMVSGHFPFDAANLTAVRERVLSGRADPLSDHRPDVPAEFAVILARAVALRPEDRFQTAGEMEGALRSFLGAGASHPRNRLLHSPHRRASLVLWIGMGAALVGALLWTQQAWLGAGQATASYQLDSRWVSVTESTDRPLQQGDVIQSGDSLVLTLLCSTSLYVYVFNEDQNGEMFTLFPVPGLLPHNPLPAGRRHRLPGSRNGVSKFWVVSSEGGGTEYFLLVASPEPVPILEELKTRVPVVAESTAAPLDAITRERVLRGVGLLGTDRRAEGSPPGAEVAARRLEDLFQSFENQPIESSGVTARLMTLSNRKR